MVSVASQNIITNKDAQTTTPDSILGWRYSLARCLSNTSLADIYWARDLEIDDDHSSEAYVLLLKVSPAIAQLNGYWEILLGSLKHYQHEEHHILPNITDSGNDNGHLWLVCPNTDGMLLNERFQDHDERDKSLNELTPILSNIARSVNELQNQPYGFLEPGAIQFHDNGVRFLNAPLVEALIEYFNNQQSHVALPEQKLTLHSGYISPSVAVGVPPDQSDDVFSLACFAYHFLTGIPPFQSHHTLEAVVRGLRPASPPKLKPSSRDALNQALALTPHVRQVSTTQFIKELRKRPSIPLVLPTAIAAALAIMGFGITHLIDQADHYIGSGSNNIASSQSANITARVQSDITLLKTSSSNTASTSEGAAANGTRTEALTDTMQAEASVETSLSDSAPSTADTLAIKQQLINLQIELDRQFALGAEADLQPAIDQLRLALNSGAEAGMISVLTNKIISREHKHVLTLIQNNELDAAIPPLQRTSKWIKEFNLERHQQAQLELETELRLQHEQKITAERLWTQAQEAFKQKQLTRSDDNDNNAADILVKLLEASSKHTGALEMAQNIVQQQHARAGVSIKKGDLDLSQSLLDDTATLVNQFYVAGKDNQSALETRYQEAIQKQRAEALSKLASDELSQNRNTAPESKRETAQFSSSTRNKADDKKQVAEATPAQLAIEKPAPAANAQFGATLPQQLPTQLITIRDELVPLQMAIPTRTPQQAQQTHATNLTQALGNMTIPEPGLDAGFQSFNIEYTPPNNTQVATEYPTEPLVLPSERTQPARRPINPVPNNNAPAELAAFNPQLIETNFSMPAAVLNSMPEIEIPNLATDDFNPGLAMDIELMEVPLPTLE